MSCMSHSAPDRLNGLQASTAGSSITRSSCCHVAADLIQLDSSACVFDRVMGLLLNVFLQQVAGQEAQTQLALPFEMEQEHSINDLQECGKIRV